MPAPLVNRVLGAVELEVFQRDVGFVADDSAAGRVHALLGDVELSHLRGERSFRDCDLLSVVAIFDARENCSRGDPLPLVKRKLDDAGLHRLEAENAFVRFDVARDLDGVRVRLAFDPRNESALETIGGGRRTKQNERQSSNDQPPPRRH